MLVGHLVLPIVPFLDFLLSVCHQSPDAMAHRVASNPVALGGFGRYSFLLTGLLRCLAKPSMRVLLEVFCPGGL